MVFLLIPCLLTDSISVYASQIPTEWQEAVMVRNTPIESSFGAEAFAARGDVYFNASTQSPALNVTKAVRPFIVLNKTSNFTFFSMIGLVAFSVFRLYANSEHMLIRHFHNIFPQLMPRGSLLFMIDHNWLNDFLFGPAIMATTYLLSWLFIAAHTISTNEASAEAMYWYVTFARDITRKAVIYFVALFGFAYSVFFTPHDWGNLVTYALGSITAWSLAGILRFDLPQKPTSRNLANYTIRGVSLISLGMGFLSLYEFISWIALFTVAFVLGGLFLVIAPWWRYFRDRFFTTPSEYDHEPSKPLTASA
jgi:hypothetical protein